ncbi:MAG: YdbH domain-containing protein [Opitutaceae bacterium]|nr:YdbH domain-containing protein [Opitutaceae bacterium]
MRLAKALLASFGGLVFVALCLTVACRKPLTEWTLRRALKDAQVEVRQLSVSAMGTRETTLGPVELEWKKQRLEMDSVNVAVGSLLPPTIRQITVSGMVVTIDPTALQDKMPASIVPERDTSGIDGAAIVNALKGVSANVDFKLGNATDPFAGLVVQGKSEGGRVEGAFSFKSGVSTASSTLKWEPDSNAFHVEGFTSSFALHELLALSRPYLPVEWSSIELKGTLVANLGGALQGNSVLLSGVTTLKATDVMMPEFAIKMSGLEGTVRWFNLTELQSDKNQVFSATSIDVGKIALGRTRGVFTLAGKNQLELEQLTTEAFGGTVSVAGQGITLEPLAGVFQIRLVNIDLAQLNTVIPTLDAELTGRLDGEVQVAKRGNRWAIAGGRMHLRRDTPATLRIKRPGMITSGMAPSGPTYDILRKVEDGFLNLRLESLEATLHEAQREDERSATITITGRPISEEVRAPVSLDINVNGPLAPLISLGLREDLSVSAKP